MDNRITITFSAHSSELIRKIAERHKVDLNAIIKHAFMLELWAEAIDRAGDEICIKNGQTGRITIMNLPAPKNYATPSPAETRRPSAPQLVMVVNNSDVQPSDKTKPHLFVVPDQKND